MANLLDNIPEDFLYSLLPPGVTDLDARGLMKGLMAGIQDCVQTFARILAPIRTLSTLWPHPFRLSRSSTRRKTAAFRR